MAFSITVVSTAISERPRGVTAPEARPASTVLVRSHSTPSSPMRPRQRAAAASKNGLFDDEIVSVEVPQRKGDPIVVTEDEGVRGDTTSDSLAKLRPAFDKSGNITAGNASQISDGGAAVIVMSKAKAESLGLTPLARFVGYFTAGVAPELFGIGPVPAIRKALARTGLSLDAMDLVELNEAFASQSLQVIRELGLDHEKVNVNGGAIAIGHPLGMSGARLVVSLLHELRRRRGRYGLATLCVGVGQGQAAIFEAA